MALFPSKKSNKDLVKLYEELLASREDLKNQVEIQQQKLATANEIINGMNEQILQPNLTIGPTDPYLLSQKWNNWTNYQAFRTSSMILGAPVDDQTKAGQDGNFGIVYYLMVYKRVRYFKHFFNFKTNTNFLKTFMLALETGIFCGKSAIYRSMAGKYEVYAISNYKINKDGSYKSFTLSNFSISKNSAEVSYSNDFKVEGADIANVAPFFFNTLEWGIWALTYCYLWNSYNYLMAIKNNVLFLNKKLGYQLPPDSNPQIAKQLETTYNSNSPLFAFNEEVTLKFWDYQPMLNDCWQAFHQYLNFHDDLIGILTGGSNAKEDNSRALADSAAPEKINELTKINAFEYQIKSFCDEIKLRFAIDVKIINNEVNKIIGDDNAPQKLEQ